MRKTKEFKLSKGRLETSLTYCVICETLSVSFDTIKHNICPTCKDVLDNGNCLVVEDIYHDDEKIVGGRCMILPKETINTEASVVCMSEKDFDKYYKFYVIRSN